MIRVVVNGAKGRMGQEVVKAVSAESDLALVGETDLGDDLRATIIAEKAEVVVDFTIPSVVVANARIIIEAGARPVIGTTGLTGRDIDELSKAVEERGLGGVIAPNFAIGAVLLMHYAEHAARYLPHVEIVELHHDKKLDAPSGTAHMTAERVAAAREEAPAPIGGSDAGFRGGQVAGVTVHSVRLPGLVAHQEVLFGAPGQTLSLRHDSISRESFMPGVVLAVREAPALDRLVVGLDKLLHLDR